MNEIAQYAVDTLSLGSTYVLLGLGLTLVFSVMGLINFAYGALIVWGGYTVAELSSHGVAYVPAVLVMALVVIMLSLAMSQFAFRPFRDAPPATLLLTSFGVLLIMQSIAIAAFGEAPRVVPSPEFFTEGFTVGDVRVSWLTVIGVASSGLVLLCLHGVLAHTHLGLEMRAVAEDAEASELLGVKPNRVMLTAFAISGLAASVAAFLWLAKVGAVTPRADLTPTLKAFIVVVIGGLGTIRGAVIGGLLLGLLETLLAAYLPSSIENYQLTFIFVVLTIVLIVRPEGIAGRQVELAK